MLCCRDAGAGGLSRRRKHEGGPQQEAERTAAIHVRSGEIQVNS